MTQIPHTLLTQAPIYSATSIFALFRNLDQEIWFEKYGLFEKSGSRNVVDQKKKVILYHKSRRNLVREKWFTRKKKSEFAEPLF